MLPHVVVSNDDGVNAPGLQALVQTLCAAGFCRLSVCGPAEEKSAQSHALSLHRVVAATAIPKAHPALLDSYAVDGTPVDSVQLALSSTILSDPKVDLLVSGINRGENCGLHIIYSGTVGAAREASIKGVRSVALSLDNYTARHTEQYAEAARHCMPLIKAMLGLLPPARPPPAGYILNVNVPGALHPHPRGYAWARQGRSCGFSIFKEAAAGQPGAPELLHSSLGRPGQLQEATSVPGVREFVREVGFVGDTDELSDVVAIQQGWISVTPLRLMQDLQPLSTTDEQAGAEMAAVMVAAARDGGYAVTGVPTEALADGTTNDVLMAPA